MRDLSKIKNNRGFVLLYTVLIASIVLSIALGITTISYQEIILSSSAREGSVAFFSADTGSECALYADLNVGAFSATTPASFTCAGETVNVTSDANGDVFNFELNLDGGKRCARVKVEKNPFDLQNQYITSTRIESLGYNLPCQAVNNSLSVPQPRLVERALRVTYGDLLTPVVTPTADVY